MKVKICGLTNAEDALMCEELGADALGFVHYDGRIRSLPLEVIEEIVSGLSPFTSCVLVCAPACAEEALELAERSSASILQLHSLDPMEIQQVRGHGVRVIRAVPPNRSEAIEFAEVADALLFEQGIPGTGHSFDYSTVPVDCCRRAIIAGGLTPSNLSPAKSLKPYALDVSSGVETTPGKKDPALVGEFIRRCKA
ncbi:MAG: phosphoribosylanthranilate isomerase [Euryarchaeota archaeon]|nr:phosphoribosylanthranilate isomerase [Euryarchaeota archaeon]